MSLERFNIKDYIMSKHELLDFFQSLVDDSKINEDVYLQMCNILNKLSENDEFKTLYKNSLHRNSKLRNELRIEKDLTKALMKKVQHTNNRDNDDSDSD
jgi:hypothetical protein